MITHMKNISFEAGIQFALRFAMNGKVHPNHIRQYALKYPDRDMFVAGYLTVLKAS